MKNFFKFRFTDFLHKKDMLLDKKLNSKLDIGIKSFNTSDFGYYLLITFNDSSTFKAWNVNKWYAWLKDGNLDGYEYVNSRVKRQTFRRLYNALEEL